MVIMDPYPFPPWYHIGPAAWLHFEIPSPTMFYSYPHFPDPVIYCDSSTGTNHGPYTPVPGPNDTPIPNPENIPPTRKGSPPNVGQGGHSGGYHYPGHQKWHNMGSHPRHDYFRTDFHHQSHHNMDRFNNHRHGMHSFGDIGASRTYGCPPSNPTCPRP